MEMELYKDEFFEDQIVLLTKPILDRFFKENNPGDLIALYTLYYHTAKWQKTNQPKCLDAYAAAKLHWGKAKLYNIKKKLQEFGLIETIKRVEKGKVTGWFIKINYIFKESTVKKIITEKVNEDPEPQYFSDSTGSENTGALSSGNLGALSSGKDILSKDNILEDSQNESSLAGKIKKQQLPPQLATSQTAFSQPLKAKKVKDAAKLDNLNNCNENKYVEYWNTNRHPPMSRHKSRTTDVYKDSSKFFEQLENGTFIAVHRAEIDWQKMEKDWGLTYRDLKNRKFSEKEIFHAIDNFIYENKPGSKSFHNRKKPKSCKDWLLNGNGHSWALVNLTRDPEPFAEKIKDERVLALYISRLKLHVSDDTAFCKFTKGLNTFLDRKASYERNYIKYVNLPGISGDKFFAKHIEFLIEKGKLKDRVGNADFTFMKGDLWWDDFSVWLINKYGKSYNLNPTEEIKEKAKENYIQNQKECEEKEKEEEKFRKEREDFLRRREEKGLNQFQVAI